MSAFKAVGQVTRDAAWTPEELVAAKGDLFKGISSGRARLQLHLGTRRVATWPSGAGWTPDAAARGATGAAATLRTDADGSGSVVLPLPVMDAPEELTQDRATTPEPGLPCTAASHDDVSRRPCPRRPAGDVGAAAGSSPWRSPSSTWACRSWRTGAPGPTGSPHPIQTSGGNDVPEEIWFLAQTPVGAPARPQSAGERLAERAGRAST